MKRSQIAPMYDQRLVQPEVPHAALNDRLESFGDAHFGSNRDRLCLGDLSTFVRTDRKCRFNGAQRRPIGTWLRVPAFAFDHKANFVVHETSTSKWRAHITLQTAVQHCMN